MTEELNDLSKMGELIDFIKNIEGYWNAARDERAYVKGVLMMRQTEAEQKNRQIKELADENTELKKQLKETQLRLSRYMAMQMTNNNPNIADLSDQNRPTKIGEMYNELYDNIWTDAFELLTRSGRRNEKESIEILREILTSIRSYCDTIEGPLLSLIRKTLLMNEDEQIPDFVLKIFKDNRRRAADESIEEMFQKYMEILYKASSDIAGMARRRLLDYTKECFKICYLMSIQDPPVVFDQGVSTTLDTTKYRLYTVNGNKIDYIVWPCVLLNDGGAVLSKGVAQCLPTSRPQSAPGHASKYRTIDPRRPQTAVSRDIQNSLQATGSTNQQDMQNVEVEAEDSAFDGNHEGGTAKSEDKDLSLQECITQNVDQISLHQHETDVAQQEDLIPTTQSADLSSRAPGSYSQHTVPSTRIHNDRDTSHNTSMSSSVRSTIGIQDSASRKSSYNTQPCAMATGYNPDNKDILHFREYLHLYGEGATRFRYGEFFDTYKFLSDRTSFL